MDAERIAEIRARVEAATPGPWEQGMIGDSLINEVDYSASFGFIEVNAELSDDGQYGVADATFIAASRQDIPDLLAEVERLSAERDMWHTDATKLDALAVKFEAELSRLRAVIEEALGAMIQHCSDADLFNLLDRGLKGECRCRDLGRWGTDTRDCPLHLETSVVIEGVGKFGTTHDDRGLKGANNE